MGGVLVFDENGQPSTVEANEPDFLLFDAVVVGSPVETGVTQDFLLIDGESQPSQVVEADGETDVLVITPGGPPGPPGPQGDQGIQGEPGLDGPGAYFQEFNFAAPATTWTIVHNQATYALSVEAVDTNGDPLEGYVRYVDLNTIEVDWYYPTAGSARVFR